MSNIVCSSGVCIFTLSGVIYTKGKLRTRGCINSSNRKGLQRNTQFYREENKMKKEIQITENLTDAMAKTTALVVKRKVIQNGKNVRNTQDVGKKLDYLSIQLSSIAALTLLSVAVSGDEKSLLSKAGVVSGLFTEDFPDA